MGGTELARVLTGAVLSGVQATADLARPSQCLRGDDQGADARLPPTPSAFVPSSPVHHQAAGQSAYRAITS